MSDIQGALDEYSQGDDGPVLATRAGVKKRNTPLKIAQEQRRVTLAEMLKVKECRDLFWWLLEQFAPMQSPMAFAPSGTDVHRTMFNAGKADAGRLLLAEITVAAPDSYLLMLKEEQERKELKNA